MVRSIKSVRLVSQKNLTNEFENPAKPDKIGALESPGSKIEKKKLRRISIFFCKKKF